MSNAKDEITSDPFASYESKPVRKEDTANFDMAVSHCLTLTQQDAEQGNATVLAWVPPTPHKRTVDGVTHSDIRGLFQTLLSVKLMFINRSSGPVKVVSMVPLSKLDDNQNVYKHGAKAVFELSPFGTTVQKSRKSGNSGRNKRNTKKMETYSRSTFVGSLYYTLQDLMKGDYNDYTLRHTTVTVNGSQRAALVLAEFYAVVPDISDQTGLETPADQKILEVKMKTSYVVSQAGALPGTTAEEVPAISVIGTPFNTFWNVASVLEGTSRKRRELRLNGITTIQFPQFGEERAVRIAHHGVNWRLEYTSGAPVFLPQFESEDIRAYPRNMGLIRLPTEPDSYYAATVAGCFKYDTVDNSWYLWDEQGNHRVESSGAEYTDWFPSGTPIDLIDNTPESTRLRSLRAESFLDTVIAVTETIGSIITIGESIVSFFL